MSPLHRTLDWASCFKSGQVFFFLHSLSTVRTRLAGSSLSSPNTIQTEDSSFRRVCPIQPHLCLLMITSIYCISAIFNRFILDIVLGFLLLHCPLCKHKTNKRHCLTFSHRSRTFVFSKCRTIWYHIIAITVEALKMYFVFLYALFVLKTVECKYNFWV